MIHRFLNANEGLKITSIFIFITILSGWLGCTSDKKESDDIANKSDLELIMEDYVEPGIKWGYIDTDGEVVIKEQFDDCRDFSGGLAAASKKGLWGYIDLHGAWIVKPVYRGTWTMRDGRGKVRAVDGKFGFIDSTGAVVILPEWDDAEDFYDGLAKVKKNDRYTFIDQKGKTIGEDTWDQAFAFQSGVARISQGGWWGLIDAQGNLLIKPRYDALGLYYDHRLPVSVKGLWGFMDTASKMIITAKYEQVTPFQGFYAAGKSGNQWSWIDTAGTLVASIFCDEVMPLGLDKWGVVRQDTFALFGAGGRQITPFIYSQINRYNDGLAVFGKDGLYGYFDSTGEEHIHNIFLLAWDFKNGVARYTLGQGMGFINKEGKAAHDGLYPDVRDYAQGLAKVQTVSRN